MDVLIDLGSVTDALLAASRCPNPDLVLVAALLDERQSLLTMLPESPATVPQRLTVLRRVQAADSELRARFEKRRSIVDVELRALNHRGARRTYRAARSHLVDRTV